MITERESALGSPAKMSDHATRQPPARPPARRPSCRRLLGLSSRACLMNSLATASSLSLRLLRFEHLPVCVPDFLVIRISSYLHFPRLLRTSRRECSLESAGASGVAGAEGPSGGPQWRAPVEGPRGRPGTRSPRDASCLDCAWRDGPHGLEQGPLKIIIVLC